jgi:RecB family exonuclease
LPGVPTCRPISIEAAGLEDRQLAALRADLRRLIDAIEATAVFEPCESALCGWCPNWVYCPAKNFKARTAAVTRKGKEGE